MREPWKLVSIAGLLALASCGRDPGTVPLLNLEPVAKFGPSEAPSFSPADHISCDSSSQPLVRPDTSFVSVPQQPLFCTTPLLRISLICADDAQTAPVGGEQTGTDSTGPRARAAYDQADVQQSFEGAVKGGSVAAGAGRHCAPAAPGALRPTAPQLHR
jgi:hypothetical protein